MEERDRERHSKDKVVGNRGGNFIEWIREKGWYILNGRTERDWEEFMYVRVYSNSIHLPLEMEIIMEKKKRRG